MLKEIIIKCVEHQEYHIPGCNVQTWNFNYEKGILRINKKDGSFIEFNKNYIIFINFVMQDMEDKKI